MLSPWIGGGGCVLLGLLRGFLLLCIGGDDPLGPLRDVADDKARVVQGHAALFPRVGAEAEAEDLVGLGEVGNVNTFEAHWRVAGSGAPWRRRCLQTAGLRQRD